jgi:hypothetical protein
VPLKRNGRIDVIHLLPSGPRVNPAADETYASAAAIQVDALIFYSCYCPDDRYLTSISDFLIEIAIENIEPETLGVLLDDVRLTNLIP